MAKKLLLDALVKVLGEFIELNEGNLDLSLAVWSGQIVLNNLKLKTDKLLRNVNLQVLHGTIKSLEIVIPWTALLNSPVKVLIDGVYLQVGPLNLDALDKKETKKRVMESKIQQLNLVDKFLDFTNNAVIDTPDDKNSSTQSASFYQQWTAKIVDNIEITLRNIHVRYEDNKSIPGSIFSAGLTLAAFTIVTCDENWHESFIARTNSNLASTIRKMARVQNLGIYWNTQSVSLINHSFDDWIKAMDSLIFKAIPLKRETKDNNNDKKINNTDRIENKTTEPWDNMLYVLSPINHLIVKLTHNERAPEQVPKFDLVIESTNLPLAINTVQYGQLKAAINMMGSVERQRQPFTYLPLIRAITPEGARQWWRYGCKLAIKRKRYIELVKLSKTQDEETGNLDVRTFEEIAEMRELDERLPLHSLLLFRYLAAREMQLEAYHIEQQEKIRLRKEQASTWWRWMSRQQPIDEDIEFRDYSAEDDVPIASIIKALKGSQSENDNKNATIVRMSLISSATLDIAIDENIVASAAMSVSALAKVTSVGLTASCDLSNMLVQDKVTINPPIGNIISVKNTLDSESQPPSFSVFYESFNEKTVIRISALPFEFCLNKICIQQLLAVFFTDDPNKIRNVEAQQALAVAAAVKKHSQQSKFHARKSSADDAESTKPMTSFETQSNEKKVLEIIFEAHAPKIIVPEDSSSNAGYLLLDCGYLVVKGSIASDGMIWDISLKDVNAGMPLTVQDMYTFGKNSLYLIKPFDINIHFQNIEKSNGEMTLDVEVKPEVRGELNALKLARLLYLIGVIHSTFFSKPLEIDKNLGKEEQKVTPIIEEIIDDNTDIYPDIIGAIQIDIDERDPLVVNLNVLLKFPVLVLDLTYDVETGNHLVFAVRTLETRYVSRAYDSQIFFDLSDLSIQDSLRAESQQYLARSENPGNKNLINITYTNSNSFKSPLYKKHATEIIVKFADLGLSMDVYTVLHLKPFVEILLFRRSEYAPKSLANSEEQVSPQKASLKTPDTPTSSTPKTRKISSTAFVVLPFKSDAVQASTIVVPTGFMISFSLEKISLDLLRTPLQVSVGEELDSAFSLQITGLNASVDMYDLMKADVRLRSVEIYDIRKISKDYVFKKVFCPVFDFQNGMDDTPCDLLSIKYNQESKSLSFVNVEVFNMTSYSPMDTILDLAWIAMANFFAILDLLSNPNPQVIPIPVSSETPLDGADSSPVYVAPNSSTMNINVVVSNPRLILLDDPTTEESRAIVGRCGIEAHYTRETTYIGTSRSLQESLHVSLKGLEVFVLHNMLKWFPLPILEPMGIEYHLRRKSINGVYQSVNMSLDMDNVDTRVSVSDIVLAQSIMMRRALTEQKQPTPNARRESTTETDMANTNTNTSFGGSSQNSPQDIPNPTSTYSLNLGSVTLIAINDFHGQNMPVMRVLLDGTTFYAEGSSVQLSGDGTLIASADFYNSKLSIWEPILDRWNPGMSIKTIEKEISFEINAEHTMQLTLSGIMIEKLLQTYSLLLRLEEVIERENIPHVVVNNLLGDSIEIDIYDSSTNTKLLNLVGGQSGPLSRVSDRSARSWSTNSHIPAVIDIYFAGKFGTERMPLYHLPLNITKARTYHLQPRVDNLKDENYVLFKNAGPNAITKKSRRVFIIEPIVEEVFENSRYDPITALWRQPYLLGDPYEWTDSSGTIRKDIQSIELPSDKWEWQGNWNVDTQGIVGEEIDNDGWEYAASFSSFSIVSKRRTAQPMDCVRRRCWSRTRAPLSSTIDEKYRPYSVFWEVLQQKNGSRNIELRSGLRIKNSMPFAIKIALSNSAWSEDIEYGPIDEGDTFSVPLLHSYASLMKVKPAFTPYEWSQSIACSIQMYDFRAIKDVICENNDLHPVSVRVLSSQSKKELLIMCLPYVIVSNKLPCDVQYVTFSHDIRKETGLLVSGTSCKLVHINLSFQPTLCFKTDGLKWSDPMSLQVHDEDNENVIDFVLSGADGKPRLALTMIKRVGANYELEIDIFSRAAMIDRSGLGLIVWSRWKQRSELTRATYDRQDKAPLVRVPLTHTEKLKTKALIRLAKHKFKQQYRNPVEFDVHVPIPTIALANTVANSQGSFTSRDSSDSLSTADLTELKEMSYKEINLNYAVDSLQNEDENVSDQSSSFSSTGNIIDFSVESQKQYVTAVSNIGSLVYTDSNTYWTYLPLQLRGQPYIRTPSNDALIKSKHLMKFSVSKASIVLILVDIEYNSEPKWLKEYGYSRLIDQARARCLSKYGIEDYHYAIFGKSCDVNEEIVLGGNWSKDRGRMYSVFVLNIPEETSLNTWSENPGTWNEKYDVLSIFDQVNFDKSYSREVAHSSWTRGGNELTLFSAIDDIIAVGVGSESFLSFSDDININLAKSSASDSFEITEVSTLKAYQLSYSIKNMPGIFCNTQLVTFVPRYCIVNCLDEPLMVLQKGTKDIMTILPFHAEGWHKAHAALGTAVRIRSGSTFWSLGAVDINEMGTSILHLPKKGVSRNEAEKAIIAHIEVKVAEPTENCSILIIVSKATIETNTAIMIKNDSNVPITVEQADVDFGEEMETIQSLFEVCVPPYSSAPFGWADPDIGSNVLITAGTSLRGGKKRIAKMSLLKSGEFLRLPDNSGRSGSNGEVILSVITENGCRVLRIYRKTVDVRDDLLDSLNFSPTIFSSDSKSPTYSIRFFLASLGVSLVLEKPFRREFLSLYIDELEGQYKFRDDAKSFEFAIMDFQVDNYSESALYPVLMHSTKKEVHKNVSNSVGTGENQSSTEKVDGDVVDDDDDYETKTEDIMEVPWLQFTVVQNQPSGTSTPVYKYIAFRVLELAVEVDSATLQLLFTDLLSDLKIVSREEALATSLSNQWIDDFNKILLGPEQRLRYIDVYKSQLSAKASKIYFEKLIIHPIKITLTFVQTPYPRKREKVTLKSTAINVLTAMAGFDRMQIKLKSFEVEDAMQSRSSILNHIKNKTIQDLRSQLAQIAGSLAVIGSPMGFARKVGGGAKAFFYEPYQGAMHSPSDFVEGLGKGTSIFFTATVSGMMNSASQFFGTASKGISHLSGDAEYVRKRAVKRQQKIAYNKGGIMAGFKDGSESLMSGFGSAMSGLVTKPFEEAKKKGVKGFFRGIGLGLIGAAVKPMMGFGDAITSVASSIKDSVGDSNMYFHVRPARALERSATDVSDLIINSLNLDAAVAQEFVIRRAKTSNYDDVFISYVPMDNEGEAIILSEMYIYWRKSKSLWGRTWANVSHFLFMGEAVGIMLYGGIGGRPEAITIPCYNRTIATRVYGALAYNANRTGNPFSIIPVDLATKDLSNVSEALREIIQAQQLKAAKIAGELEGYCFGTANGKKLKTFKGSEQDILKLGEGQLDLGYSSWQELDEKVWEVIWNWDSTHIGLKAARCCVTTVINLSDTSIQIARVQMVHGRNVMILGSSATRYDKESRAILPDGIAIIFIWAFSPSPIEIGHIKANVNTAAFSATLASTQRESICEAKGGFQVGFLEKTVSEFWSKYFIVVES